MLLLQSVAKPEESTPSLLVMLGYSIPKRRSELAWTLPPLFVKGLEDVRVRGPLSPQWRLSIWPQMPLQFIEVSLCVQFVGAGLVRIPSACPPRFRHYNRDVLVLWRSHGRDHCIHHRIEEFPVPDVGRRVLPVVRSQSEDMPCARRWKLCRLAARVQTLALGRLDRLDRRFDSFSSSLFLRGELGSIRCHCH